MKKAIRTLSDLTELEKSFILNYRAMDEDQREIVDLIVLLFEEANKRNVDVKKYDDTIKHLLKKCKRTGDFEEIQTYLIATISSLQNEPVCSAN